MQELAFVVDTTDFKKRIDKFLAERLTSYSRSYLQTLLRSGNIKVNDATVKANYVVVPGDHITIEIPEQTELDVIAEDIPLDILYEDAYLMIINKPKGMVVHPSAGHLSGTLVNALLYYFRNQENSLSGINGVLRPGIVHRIDKDTTGALVICKDDMTHKSLALQLQEHTIQREYRAIVWGILKEDSGTIDAPIGRHPTDRKKMAINQVNGKPAVTHYTVLQRFSKFTYISCRLETGRTHQIRVHMTSIGHPLLGDEVYGMRKSAYKLQGQTLHARLLGFEHPHTHQYMEAVAELPAYFAELLVKLP
ncbi:MAG: RluA family pseudouridine synthase [Lachnospiraceae bacterium]